MAVPSSMELAAVGPIGVVAVLATEEEGALMAVEPLGSVVADVFSTADGDSEGTSVGQAS